MRRTKSLVVLQSYNLFPESAAGPVDLHVIRDQSSTVLDPTKIPLTAHMVHHEGDGEDQADRPQGVEEGSVAGLDGERRLNQTGCL